MLLDIVSVSGEVKPTCFCVLIRFLGSVACHLPILDSHYFAFLTYRFKLWCHLLEKYNNYELKKYQLNLSSLLPCAVDSMKSRDRVY